MNRRASDADILAALEDDEPSPEEKKTKTEGSSLLGGLSAKAKAGAKAGIQAAKTAKAAKAAKAANPEAPQEAVGKGKATKKGGAPAGAPKTNTRRETRGA